MLNQCGIYLLHQSKHVDELCEQGVDLLQQIHKSRQFYTNYEKNSSGRQPAAGAAASPYRGGPKQKIEKPKIMARGKIQIKKIENQTNRQVTYSKRRNGLFKKAHELTVLCDAKVSILMISTTQKLHEYISPTITTKQMFDQYQKAVGVDLWNSHYEKMQEHLKKQKEINRNLRREIRQRIGESLNDLGYDHMVNLIEDIENSLRLIREKKKCYQIVLPRIKIFRIACNLEYKVIGNQIDTSKKKVRNAEEIHRTLALDFEHARHEDPHYGLVENEGDYNSVLGYPNGGPRIIALRYPPNHHHNPNHHHPNLHSGGGSELTFALLE
ncbi:hypothetical protein DH2020_035256 [Rehmannia glutinosa]|uniref:MADS box transcription factor n=1 Tax=Rehmannia glutinosa TaxID=99300 RepID=A0ABR0V6Z6_REHGL